MRMTRVYLRCGCTSMFESDWLSACSGFHINFNRRTGFERANSVCVLTGLGGLCVRFDCKNCIGNWMC